MARVTVALAVYNGSATLAKALEAVRAQTYRDYEILVLDDGSTDDSEAIAREFTPHVLTVPNAGLGAGRRRLTEESASELIAFVDHDDFWTPDKLARQIEALDDTGADLVHSDGVYVYEDGREVPRRLRFSGQERSFDHILPDNRVIASTAVYRRSAMLEAGNFVADTVRCSDWYGWMILAPGRRFVHVPEVHVRYSVLSTSLANAGYRFHEAQHYVITTHFLPRASELFAGLPSSESSRYQKMLRRDAGIALSGMAKHKSRLGERQAARELHRQAVRLAPTVPRVLSRAVRAWFS